MEITESLISSIINFAAAVLILLAAVIPLVYKMWKRAKNENTTDKIKYNTLSIVIILFYAIGLFWGWSRGPVFSVFVLFSAGFAFQCILFYIQNTPIDRQSVLFLVIQAMLVVTTLNLYFANLFVGVLEKVTG